MTLSVSGPRYESRSYGETLYIDAGAILHKRRLHLFLTNRFLDEPADVTVDSADISLSGLQDAEILTGPEAGAANSFEKPDMVRSHPFEEILFKDGRVTVKLSPLSFTAMTVNVDR